MIFERYDPTIPIDLVIVGAGLSGLQVAKDLSRYGATRVWVFEAGPNLGLEHLFWEFDTKYAHEMWQLLREDKSFYRPWTPDTQPHYSGVSGLRRRLGGRSLYWHGAVIRLEPWVLSSTAWPRSVVQDLTETTDDHPSYYDMQEREVMIAPATSGAKRLTALLQSVGYEEASPTPLAVRYSRTRDGDERWAAYSPLDYWREAVLQEDSAHVKELPRIACNTEILGILAHRGRVAGVQVRDTRTGAVTDVRCPNVVLAAGTIENARLVLSALTSVDEAGRESLSGLMDHLVTGFMYHVPLDTIPSEWSSLQIPSFVFIRGTAETRYNIFVSITRSHLSSNRILVDTWAMGEQLPQRDNRIYLDSAKAEPYRKVRVSAQFSKDDLQLISHARKALIELSNALLNGLGTSESFSNSEPEFPVTSIEEFARAFKNAFYKTTPALNPTAYLSSLGTVDHEAGTLPFGTVLTDKGECREMPGLYIVGPCTFPRIGAANPSLTTLALAKRTAHYLQKTAKT
jgi:choline dehydrogenase-like flavoprotein